jgi:hypothetical protein
MRIFTLRSRPWNKTLCLLHAGARSNCHRSGDSVWWNRDWRTEAKRAIADALSLDAVAAAQIFHELLRRKLIEAHVNNEDAQKVGSGKASGGMRARYYRTKQTFHGVELWMLRKAHDRLLHRTRSTATPHG